MGRQKAFTPRATYLASWQRLWDRVRWARFAGADVRVEGPGPPAPELAEIRASGGIKLTVEEIEELGDVLEDAAHLEALAEHCAQLEDALARAAAAWKASHDGREVARELGFLRADGKRGDQFVLSEVFAAYTEAKLGRRADGSPLTKAEAAKSVKAKLGFQSEAAAMKYMERANRAHRERFGFDLFT